MSLPFFQKHRKIRDLFVPIKLKTAHLVKVFHRSILNTPITEQVINNGFLYAWDANQCKTIDERILTSIEELENFKSKCAVFEHVITAAQPKQIHFDREKMNAMGLLKNVDHFNPQLDYDKLIEWIMHQMPMLIDAIHFKAPWPVDKLQIESHLLEQHIRRANSLLLRIDALKTDSLELNSTKDGDKIGAAIYWREKLFEKLVLTPTIKLPSKTNRIAIWDTICVDSIVKGLASRSITEDTSGNVSCIYVQNQEDTIEFDFRRVQFQVLMTILNLVTALQCAMYQRNWIQCQC